jgi:tetratricopeptide (TPR) repeat protein
MELKMRGKSRLTVLFLFFVFVCTLHSEEADDLQRQIDAVFQEISALGEEMKNQEVLELVLLNQDLFTQAGFLANWYGQFSWYYLLTKEFGQAEEAAKKALELDGSQTWVKVNLAHAMFLQRKYREAETLYGELSRTVVYEDETSTQTVLDGFEYLEQAGIIPSSSVSEARRIQSDLMPIRENHPGKRKTLGSGKRTIRCREVYRKH